MSLRKKINKLLSHYGYEITKIDRFGDLLAQEYARSQLAQQEFFFVQIGANDGVRFDSLYDFVTQRNCAGLVVEPLARYFAQLEDNYRAFPAIKAVKTAIHASDKLATMYHVDPDKMSGLSNNAAGIGSLDPKHHQRSQTPSANIITEQVACVSLMALIDAEKVEKINLLQIDVEGYDAEVIKMLDFNRIRPNIIKYEHESLPQVEQQLVEKLLLAQGYQLFQQGSDSIAYC